MKQFLITPSMGKRLIAKALVEYPPITSALDKGTLVIVAGTTNGYVAEEVLAATGRGEGFSRKGFYRGLVTPAGPTSPGGAGSGEFPGDVVIVGGVWHKSRTIFDVADELSSGDVILKGANAVNVSRGRAGVYIGDPQAGTAGAAIRAVYGRRVRLIVPVGLEKRVTADIDDLAARLNAPGAQGPRLLPLPGEVFTELDAISHLTGAAATLVAAGGVRGAEGAVWIAAEGDDRQLEAATELVGSVSNEPLCQT